jgi:hypothetical protein
MIRVADDSHERQPPTMIHQGSGDTHTHGLAVAAAIGRGQENERRMTEPRNEKGAA